MSAIRIYGEAGCGSIPEVADGLQRSCEAHGLFAGRLDCRSFNPEEQAPGASAPVAICCGSPGYLKLPHTLGRHKRRWFMFAPNSEGVPSSFVRNIMAPAPVGKGNLIDGVLTPSQWGCAVLKRCFHERPVVYAPHGVAPAFKVIEANRVKVASLFADGHFFVLHVTSSPTNRKGTMELLNAWATLREHNAWDGARLLIMAHPMFATRYSGRAIKLGLTEEAGVAVRAGFASPVAQVAESYSFAHVLCQPSRAEGFGMCGLEARACGVPVVATACTGHSEWMPATEEERRSSGVVLVPHGEEAPSDDFLGAKAPSVSSAEIAVALLDARARWEALSEAAIASAEHVQSYWAWERVTEPALRHIVADAEQAP